MAPSVSHLREPHPVSRASDHDVVIVGGGPAGASAACLLARGGSTPLLIERDPAPRHKICGEFLSHEAQAYLAALGIDPQALGGALIDRVRLVHGDRSAEAPLPFSGVGLTRRTLDEALLRRAQECGVAVRRGIAARAIEPDGGGALRIRLQDGQPLRAGTVFLATGKHDLRNVRRPAGTAGGDLIGFKTYFTLAPAQQAEIRDTVEIILFEGGYAGLQRVEAGMVNLCLLVRSAVFDEAGRTWDRLLDHLSHVSPHLRHRLAGAAPLLQKPLSIAHVPYGFVHRATPADPDGLFRLGDQAAVIPSFSGGGISIALHTGKVAAATFLEGGVASAFHGRVRTEIRRQIRTASALYRLSRGPLGRAALLGACQLFPGMLRHLTLWTRLPAAALHRTGIAACLEGSP